MFYRYSDTASVNIDNINQIIIVEQNNDIDENSLDAYDEKKYQLVFKMTNQQEIALDQKYSYVEAKEKLYRLINYFNGLQQQSK